VAIYLSFNAVQPFAKITMEDLDEPPGVSLVRGDGVPVGIRFAHNELVLMLPELIERFDLPAEKVWARLRGDDDVMLGRRGLHGGQRPR
jgi:hypothetical protein